MYLEEEAARPISPPDSTIITVSMINMTLPASERALPEDSGRYPTFDGDAKGERGRGGEEKGEKGRSLVYSARSK